MDYTMPTAIPTYTPLVHTGTEAYALKCKGEMLNRRIRQLSSLPRSYGWAEEVTCAAAAIPLLPRPVTRHFSELALLKQLLAETEDVLLAHDETLTAQAKEISKKVSAAYAPSLELPTSEETRFSVEFCTEAEALCEKRISWCTAAITYEPEYFRLSEAVRRKVSDIDGFGLAPLMLRAAVVDKEIFGVMKLSLTAPDYDWIAQIALVETKFSLLTPDERENTISAPYLTRLIEYFKTCIAIEEKIEKDPAYGKHVHKEKQNCRKNGTPFLRSAVFRQIKKPTVENVFNCTERRQCVF